MDNSLEFAFRAARAQWRRRNLGKFYLQAIPKNSFVADFNESMGWDISMYAEVRRESGWQLVEAPERNPYFDSAFSMEEPEWRPIEIYAERNSALFAILAGIGWLGGEHSPFPCLSPPRGAPCDLSPELSLWYAQNDGNTLAASWLLLEELTRFDWHGTRVLRRGVVEPPVARTFRSAQGDEPDPAWPKETIYSFADDIIEGSAVEVRWWESCAESVGPYFVERILYKLRGYGLPDRVRVVFWFNF